MNTSVSFRPATAADRDAIWRVRSASIRGLCQSDYGEAETEAWAAAPMPEDFADVIRGCEISLPRMTVP